MDSRFRPEALKAIVERSGLRYIENSKSYIFDCPLCCKTKKLYIRKTDGRFVCWKCNEDFRFSGRPEYALTELLRVPVSEIREQLYGVKWVQADDSSYVAVQLVDFYSDEDEAPSSECELPEIVWNPLFVGPDRPIFQKKAAPYLATRNVPDDLVSEYQIKYDPITQRVVVPVFVAGKLRGWQARLIHNDVVLGVDGKPIYNPKILSTKGLSGGSVLMFQDRLQGLSHAVLTEGPFDGMKAHLCGGNVASMGKKVTHKQLMILVLAGIKKLYVALDPDAAGEVMRVAREMWEMELYRLVPPPHREDLGDCTLEEALVAFRAADRFSPTRLYTYLETPKWLHAGE